MDRKPIVGVTCEVDDRSFTSRRAYAEAILRAGGVPILLCPPADSSLAESVARAHAAAVDAVVFTGGDDPRMESYGQATHPQAKVMHSARQAYEEALLRILDEPDHRDTPVLGVCMGMQMMGLHAGANLEQHLPDVLPSAGAHAKDNLHRVEPAIAHDVIRAGGAAPSWHHQALSNPGRLRVVAKSDDGVIEAVDDPARPFYLGVQWHPERAPQRGDPLGDGLFEALIARAAQRRARAPMVRS